MEGPPDEDLSTGKNNSGLMRLVVQRVRHANVHVQNSLVGSIDKGLLVYVGFSREMTEEKLQYMVRKLLKARLWPSDEKGFDLSVSDVGGDILIVSQFTLHGYLDGNKPNFKQSAAYADARYWYERLIEELRQGGLRVASGQFGGSMLVESCNEGPTTLLLER